MTISTLQGLKDENETLRERIRQLEHELGIDAVPVGAMGLTAREGSVLGAILKAPEICTRQRIYQTIYGGDDDAADPKVIDVLMHKIRLKIKDIGATITTHQGVGYSIDPVSKLAIEAIIKHHGDDMAYWNEENTETAIRMWRAGDSGQDIVDMIAPRGELTRNAVIGRMHRLHIQQGKKKDLKGAHLNGPGSAPKRKPKTVPHKPVGVATKARINADAATRGAKVEVKVPSIKVSLDVPYEWPELVVSERLTLRQPEVDIEVNEPVRFVDRRDSQCAFPLWCDRPNPPLESKMVCGARVSPEQANPYCAEHEVRMRTAKPVDKRPYIGMRTGAY